MNQLFLLLFGIVLVGLVVYFLKYKSTFEAFEVASSVPVVESDKFLNVTLDPVTPTFNSFSTLSGVKENFKRFVTDWQNFSGNTDRNSEQSYSGVKYTSLINNTFWRGYVGTNGRITVTYQDYDGMTVEKNVPTNDIVVRKTITNDLNLSFYRDATFDFLLYFRGQLWQNNDDVGTNSESIPAASNVKTNPNATSGNFISIDTFSENFNKFIRVIQKNKQLIIRSVLQNFQPWNISGFENKLSASYYSKYNAKSGNNIADWGAGDISIAGTGGKWTTINYNIGQYRGGYTLPVSLATANSERLKLYVYGSFCNYHSNDFRESLHWGSAFDFKETTLLDMYLNVPYRDKYLNGSNIFYSYGHFFSEVKPKSTTDPFVYVPNNVCISNNAYLVNLRTESSILTPSTLEPTPTYDGDGNIASITYLNNQNMYQDISQIATTSKLLSNTTLQEQFVGKISPQVLAKMPIMMRRFIISWVYNRTFRTLDSSLENEHWDNDPISYNINKAALLITLAYNNWSNTTNGPIKATWSNYLTKYLYSNVEITKTDNANLAGYNMGALDGRLITGSTNPEINALATVVLLGNPNTSGSKAKGLTFSKETSRYWGQQWGATAPAITPDPTNKGLFYRLNIGNNTNLSYKTTGNTWDLTNTTIQNMIGDFKVNIAKIVPDYGIASNINVLDQKMLDSIAQSFYEYSDGLFEMNFIYDVYPIGSNMMDIRFDKKQRLGPLSYISLRNQYQPKIIEYNSLVNLYEQNTWKDTYSNVNDLLSNISTIKTRDLDSVFNPLYTVGNRNPDAIRADINRTLQSNVVLSNQLTIATTGITTVLRTPEYTSSNSNAPINSNVSNYFDTLLNTNNSPMIDIANIQQQIDSNDTLLNNLSNQLDGIETNVARIFFTMTSPTNLTVNGVALGPNAALSYNPIYNAGLQTDMGQSQGNVNYQPTILYTKNVTPIIDANNIEFMKKAAQLYMDAVPNSLSSFTKSTYITDEDGVLTNGFVRVDKIFGSRKLDDKTVGFTWQESQYDYYTNKPNVQRIVDVVLKFAFDNTEYQNPQIYIDNQVSNILTSNGPFKFTQLIDIEGNNLSNITWKNYITKYKDILDISPILNNRLSNLNIFFQSSNVYTSTIQSLSNMTENNRESRIAFGIDRLLPGNWFLSNALDAVRLGNANKIREEFAKWYTNNSSDPIRIANAYSYYDNPVFSNSDILKSARKFNDSFTQQRTTFTYYSSNDSYNDSSIIPLSNLAVKLFYELDEETLDNNDGACPANMVCGNPLIIKQLVDSYNFDSNNSDKILRVFKAFTPNAFRCDYSVEMANSNGTTKKGTIAFDVGQDIADCTYYITSNHGFNRGYYIIDKVDYVNDTSGVDISGYNYIENSLYDYTKSVTNIFNPLINSASNAVSSMITTLTSSRLMTYNSLGKMNSIIIPNCGELKYETLSNLLVTNPRILYSFFSAYPYVDSHMNKIYRVGIRDDNLIEVVYEKLNYAISSNTIIDSTSETAGAIYSLGVTQGYCDYTANFISNSIPFPPKYNMDLSNKLNYARYNSNVNLIYDDLNLSNPLPKEKLNPTEKKFFRNILQLYENKQQRSASGAYYVNHAHISNVISYKLVNFDTVDYKILITPVTHDLNVSYENSPVLPGNYITNYTIRFQFNKSQYVNSFNLISYNGNVNNSDTTTYTSINKSGNPNAFDFSKPASCPNLDFIALKHATGLPNITHFIQNPTNPMECEYYCQPVNEVLPFSKMFYKVVFYYNDNCSDIKVFSITPATMNNTLFVTDITSINNTILVNVFKNMFEATNPKIKIATFNSIDQKISNNLILSVSLLYFDEDNNYDFTRTPNIASLNTLQYFKVFYLQLPSVTTPNNNPFIVIKYDIATPPTNPTLFTYTPALTIPGKDFFIDNLLWKYVRFIPISVPIITMLPDYANITDWQSYDNDWITNRDSVSNYQISQIEFFKNNMKINVSMNNNFSNIVFLTNSNNVNVTNISRITQFDARYYEREIIYQDEFAYGRELFNTYIEFELIYPASFNGFSFTTGTDSNKLIKSWKLEVSVDNSNFFDVNTVNNRIYNTRPFYRLPIHSFVNTRSNVYLPQNPYFNFTLYDCTPTIFPYSTEVTRNYTYYSLSNFNNDTKVIFSNIQNAAKFQDLILTHYKYDNITNTVYHILKTKNILANEDYYVLYSIEDLKSKDCSVFNIVKPKALNSVDVNLINTIGQSNCDNWPDGETCIMYYDFIVYSNQDTVFSGTSDTITNVGQCYNYINNTLINLTSDQFNVNTNIQRYDINYQIIYNKVDRTNYSYSYILSNYSHRNIYLLDNANFEGIIYYSDTTPIDYIIENKYLSNTEIQLNNLNSLYTNLGVYEVKIQLDRTRVAENLAILECVASYQDFTYNYFTNSVISFINLSNTNINTYAQTNNFILNNNNLLNSVHIGVNTFISIFNSNILIQNTNAVKSNCQIAFTNTSNMSMKFQSEPYNIAGVIVYGKTFSNDSLRYNYILKAEGADDEFYTEYSIKFYYGSLSNRVYKDTLYFSSSNYFCSYDYTIQELNVFQSSNISSYVSLNNYQNLLTYSATYMRILNNVRACSNSLHPLSNTFMDYIYGANGFTPVPSGGLVDFSPIRTKLLYYKNNLEQLANNYVFSIHTSNNLVNPDYVEYRLNIEDIEPNCTNIIINRVRDRILTYSDMLQLSNNNYVSYMDGINIEQNMSNSSCGINYNSLLDSDIFIGPLNSGFEEILRTTNKLSGSVGFTSVNILYKRYQLKFGTAIYSYLISVNNSFIVEYSLYFLHVSYDCINTWAYYMNSSNISNPAEYAAQNNYVSAIATASLSQTQMMQIYSLSASNATFINTINTKVSALTTNATYTDNLLSLRYVQSDYTNLTNRYVIGVWPDNTPITLDSLINTVPEYIEYTITLSNIVSATNYTYSSTTIPTLFGGDINDYQLFSNNIFYKNGTSYNTTFYELSYSPYNCFTFYNASDLIGSIADLNIPSIVENANVNLTGESLNGIVAYKTNNVTRTYDYITEIIQSGIFYYPIIKISLGTPTSLETCSSYLTDLAFNKTFVTILPQTNLLNYITTNGFTSNINFTIGQQQIDTTNTNTDGFKNYEHFITKKNIYSFIMFESENNFKIQEFKLYTFNDIEIPIEITNQTNNSLFIKNKNDHIIKGYSFITNSYSSSYDPKIWSIKATNDGRAWKTLDTQSLNNNIPRNYQMPIIYFNGTTKTLPQPVSKSSDKPKVYTLDKETLVKYYKQKINSSITPTFKKYMRDNDTYYCLFDAYDLNKNIVGSDLIVGFVMRDKSVKKAILYENDEGNYVPFDLKKKKMKEFWERTIMLPLVFSTSF